MPKTEPLIRHFMTRQPHAVEAGETVQNAGKMMTELGVRHLPVMENEKVTGIISDRDIKMVFSLIEETPNLFLVKDISYENPYTADIETPLKSVVMEMADKSYGSAIIVQNQKLAGVFTTVDACRALTSLLKVGYKHYYF